MKEGHYKRGLGGVMDGELTTPSFLVSNVTTPCDEIVALQEIHELWVGQSGSKLHVSTSKTLNTNSTLPLKPYSILMFI